MGFIIIASQFIISNVNYPQRIISLGPVLTEELYLLGVEDRLVANTIYCENPPDAKKKEKIGTVIEVDLEKIISLKPDLVLATPLSNPKQVEKIKNLGIKVVNFSAPGTFQQICNQFLELGDIVGKEEKANEIVHQGKSNVRFYNWENQIIAQT